MLEQAISRYEVTDAARVWAERNGHAPGSLAPTCFPVEGAPSRVDGFLLNDIAADMLVDYEVMEGWDFPTHRPVRITLDWGRARQRVPRMRKPAPLPKGTCWSPAEAREKAEEAWAAKQNDWREARLPANREKGAAWRIWSHVAEEFLIDRAAAAPEGKPSPLEKPRGAYRGRGHTVGVKKSPLVAPQARGKAPAVDHYQGRLGRRLRRLEEVIRRVNGRSKQGTTGACRSKADATRRQAALQDFREVWVKVQQEGAELLPDSYEWSTPGLPGSDELLRLHRARLALQGLVQKRVGAMTKRRRLAFQEAMQEDWAGTTRANFRYVRHEVSAKNDLLQKEAEEGGTTTSLTGSQEEILGLFLEGWKKYFRPYLNKEAPQFADLLAAFQGEIAGLKERAGAPPRPPARPARAPSPERHLNQARLVTVFAGRPPAPGLSQPEPTRDASPPHAQTTGRGGWLAPHTPPRDPSRQTPRPVTGDVWDGRGTRISQYNARQAYMTGGSDPNAAAPLCAGCLAAPRTTVGDAEAEAACLRQGTTPESCGFANDQTAHHARRTMCPPCRAQVVSRHSDGAQWFYRQCANRAPASRSPRPPDDPRPERPQAN